MLLGQAMAACAEIIRQEREGKKKDEEGRKEQIKGEWLNGGVC